MPDGAQGTDAPYLDPIWTMTAPGGNEKAHGKHPTQKPVALIERCLLASTNAGDLVLDPFLGGGTTAIAAIKLKRGCVGVEADFAYFSIATKRADKEIVLIWLRHFRVRVEISVVGRAGSPLPAADCQRACSGSHDLQMAIVANGYGKIFVVGSLRAPVPTTSTRTHCRLFESAKLFLFDHL